MLLVSVYAYKQAGAERKNDPICRKVGGGAIFLFILFLFFYLSHTQLYREYITSSEMYSLNLTHPK